MTLSGRKIIMKSNYYRVTVYHPAEDISAIFDSNGYYDKLWQLSSALLQKGFKVLEVASDEKFLDVNIERAEYAPDKLILRAHCKGQPEYVPRLLDGVAYTAIKVGDKIYIPERQCRFPTGLQEE